MGAVVLAAFVALLAYDLPASAGDILMTAGSLHMTPSTGPLALSGERGFVLQARVSATAGIFAPYSTCNLTTGPCGPGDTVSLRAAWSSTDLPGTASLDGVSYTSLGGMTSASVDFSGSFVLPSFGLPQQQIRAPFVMTGLFSYSSGRERLYGAVPRQSHWFPTPGCPAAGA